MSSLAARSIHNRLIRRSIDLRQLYRHAARECEPGLRLVFAENAQMLDQLVAELQSQVRDGGGKPRQYGSWCGAMHRNISGWLIRAAARRDNTWIRALAHREQILLDVFEQAVATAPSETRLLLRKQLPRLHAIHMDMHYLGGASHF